jgi:hypothetical protein
MDKYNTAHICTYIESVKELLKKQKPEDNVYNEDYVRDDKDDDDCEGRYEEQKELINKFYQDDFLAVFGLKEYDDERISYVLDGVENTMNSYPRLERGLMRVALVMNTDTNFGVAYLFSYSLLFYTHKCLCEYVNSGEVKEDTINEWYDKIEKFFEESKNDGDYLWN